MENPNGNADKNDKLLPEATDDLKDGRKSNKSNKGSAVSKGAKLKMPSTQAGLLTKAYHRLKALEGMRDAKDVVEDALVKAEAELLALRAQVDGLLPADIPQQQYKDEWIKSNLADKEEYILRVRHNFDQICPSKASSRISVTSSIRRAAIEAEEEEAKLLMEQQQLKRVQDRRRRQKEEETRLEEQREQDELERRLAGVRVRKEALDKAMSERESSIRSLRFPVPPLPRIQQPTDDWLKMTREAPPPEQLDLAEANPTMPPARAPQHQDTLLSHMLLSQIKLPTFKGEHTEYLWFKQAFEQQVETVTLDPNKRLYTLLRHLDGEPLTLVRGCQLDPVRGFERAKLLLEERYGNSVRQAMAFASKLYNFGAIKTPTDLANFSVQLQLCQEVKAARPDADLSELDSPTTLLRLASKLSNKLQGSWQNKVVDIEAKQNRPAKFYDFINFVKRAEQARNHPIYGKLNVDTKERALEEPKFAARARAFNTTASAEAVREEVEQIEVTPKEGEEEHSPGVVLAASAQATPPDAFKAPCLLCKGSHATSKCKTAANIPTDQRLESLRGLCFACLKPGHSARTCRARLKCDTCQGLHPTILHEEGKSKLAQARTDTEEATTSNVGPKENSLATKGVAEGARKVALAVVPIRVVAQPRTQPIVIRALLDPGSMTTFITAGVASKLGAQVDRVELALTTLAGEERTEAGVLHGLVVESMDESEQLSVPTAYVVENIPVASCEIPEEQLRQWPHLHNVPTSREARGQPIEMLMGQNVPKALWPLDLVRGQENEPYAVCTALGWTVQGPVQRNDSSPVGAVASHRATTNLATVNDVQQSLARLFYEDFCSAYDFSTKGFSQEDRHWLSLVQASIRRVSGHFVVDLPFREKMLTALQDNRAQAYRRLMSLQRRFQSDPAFRSDYCAFVQKMIDANHVELVPNTGGGGRGHVVNYVPHHGVYHPQKKKIRVVFNCASRFRGIALNDCLYSGPDLTNSIVAVLVRFRQYRVAFMADVEAMFYQVLVPEEQRDMLRFLWWRNGDPALDVETYRMRVHLFGATSSPSVANFALRKSGERAWQEGLVDKDVWQTINKNFYVDDCLKSVPTEDEAQRIAQGLMTACQSGGFRLTKFVSTSLRLLQSLPQSELAKGLEEVRFNDEKTDPLAALQEKALGVAWNIAEDCFTFKIKLTEERPTKRTILSQLSQIYDPLGLAAPVVIVARIIFRELTRQAEGWDDELEGETRKAWDAWRHQLGPLSDIKVPRPISMQKSKDGSAWEMHIFSDASQEAYSAVIFLRSCLPDETGQYRVVFLFGKCRVAPPKVVTIPRLELTAAKLAAEMSHTVGVMLELKVEKRVYWTDSEVVLKYLKNEAKRFHTFVANRIHSILSLTDQNNWRHVPTQFNPADAGSRGLRAHQLATSSWLRGPHFLQQHESTWPTTLRNVAVTEDDPEVRRSKEGSHATSVDSQPAKEKKIMDEWVQRYSGAHRFRRAMAIWQRFISWLHDKQQAGPLAVAPITATELQEAERSALKWLQRETWPQAFLNAARGKPCKEPSLRMLEVRIESGLLVLRSRTGKVLPVVPAGHFSKLLIREGHERRAHMGRQATMAEVSRNYWVVSLQQQVRREVRDCALCQRLYASTRVVKMADLPPSRSEPSKPFTITGVDYFGPLAAKRGRIVTKLYGVIFTCASTRAVHLEVAEGLSGSSFLNALRRFVARRGHVQQMISDNGTNLVSGKNQLEAGLLQELREAQGSNETQEEMKKRGITWKLNPPGASHHGGFWERLIRVIRRCLLAVAGARALTLESLTTLLCECEAILNDRPLTSVSTDPQDLEALTPNHILIGQKGVGPVPCGDFNVTAATVRNKWKTVQRKAEQFWSRWKGEYLTLLHHHSKWLASIGRPLRVNDVVLVAEPGLARQQWLMGRVEQVHPSTDGKVRTVSVGTRRGVLLRPATKISLLETASAGAGTEG